MKSLFDLDILELQRKKRFKVIYNFTIWLIGMFETIAGVFFYFRTGYIVLPLILVILGSALLCASILYNDYYFIDLVMFLKERDEKK